MRPARIARLFLLLAAAIVAVISARPVRAQTESVLYNFTSVSGDGRAPQAGLISDGQGNFFGTTTFGGAPGGYGTVFESSPNDSGGWIETPIYTFTGGADGADPYGPVMFDSAGNLYGTTEFGGAYDKGTVFELSPTGSSWTETVLHSFGRNRDGQIPLNNLLMDQAGNLYGTTQGEVFELSPSGGAWNVSVIYHGVDDIMAGLTMDASGNIFGTSLSTVFELSPNGKGGWHKQAIYTFSGGPKDGAYARGTPALDRAGNLYGTTAWGGLGGGNGDGTVYELSPAPNGTWTEKILYFFKGGKDANNPSMGGIVLDAAGNIYGTTYNGGKFGIGTVFEVVAPHGKKGYHEKVLWSFNGTNGSDPSGGLILDSAGNLYGTTAGGGDPNYCSGGNPNGCGVVFEVTP